MQVRRFLVLLLLPMSMCTVKYTYLKPAYEANERLRLKRVVIVAEGAANADQEKKNALFFAVSREFISHHHEYIVLRAKKGVVFTNVKEYCAADKRLNGLILNKFRQWDKQGGSVKLEVQSVLYDCVSGDRVWEAIGANTYASEDSGLKSTIDAYVRRVGEEVRDHVAPVYLLVRKLFSSLPDPKLTEKDIDEKIEADSD